MNKKRINSVSDTTMGNGLAPSAPKELTADGLDPDSEAAAELNKQRDFLARVAKPALVEAANARRKYDQEWLARNLFWRGYHFSRYLPQTQTVVLSSRQSARVPVNLVTSYMRAIRNQVTSFRPKWEVLPRNPSMESSKTQARYAGRLLDYYFDKLKLKMMIKETITQGLLYSVGGPWQIGYDPIKKDVFIWLEDPFDHYVDPFAEDPNEGQYQIKTGRCPMAAVTHNPTYNDIARNEISGGDPRMATSEYKQFMIQATKNVSTQSSDASSTVIPAEGYFRRYRDTGEMYMVKCIWTDQNLTPLYYEEIDDEEYDFEMYRADLNPKEIYGESWIKHVMPINRVIDSLESSAFDYNYRVAKGRILIDRDSGVRAIHNLHGEIIAKNRGSEVKSLDMAPLPVAVAQQIERMWRYMEDISGLHEASLGRIPTGVKTGIGIAELKQADATSQDDLVDNLEDFLTNVAKKLLKKIAQNLDTFKVVRDLGVREGEEKYFVAIGEKFSKNKKLRTTQDGVKQVKIGPDWLDVAEIAEDNNIRVTVGSWLGYTKEAMQQKILSYYQLQLIDQKTALKLLEFGDPDEIVQQTRIEAILKKPVNPNNPQEVDQMDLAMTENDMLLEGKEMPVSENDDHVVHIAIHQEAFGRGFDDIVGLHIAKHQLYLGHNGPIAGSNGLDVQDNQQSPGGPMAASISPVQAVNAAPVNGPQNPPVVGNAGAAPGTQLPQQNIAQVMATNAAQAGQNLG